MMPLESDEHGQYVFLPEGVSYVTTKYDGLTDILDALHIRWELKGDDRVLIKKLPSILESEIIHGMRGFRMEEAESEQDTSGLSAPESPPLERVRHQHFPYAPLQSNPHTMPASLQPARGPYAPPAPRNEPAMIVNLDDQFPIGPETASNPYTSVGVLAPCITIERHGQQLHIAARFNIETTIQNYSSANSDSHELFFHDICLQYLNHPVKEDLAMWPQSDSTRSFAVTRSTNSTVSGNAGLSLSQMPSGNVSLGLSRSSDLSIEYQVGTYSVSAHYIGDRDSPIGQNKSSSSQQPKTPSKKTAPSPPWLESTWLNDKPPPRYQWFWAGTQDETKKLTPDLKHTVKRHVVVRRIVNLADFPFDTIQHLMGEDSELKGLTHIPEQTAEDHNKKGDLVSQQSGKTAEESATSEARKMLSVAWRGKILQVRQYYLRKGLERYFTFKFCTTIRVKRRYGRLHRLFILSGNEVKAGYVKPTYREDFELCPGTKWIDEFVAECCYAGQAARVTLDTVVGEKWNEPQIVNTKAATKSTEIKVDEMVADDELDEKEKEMIDKIEDEKIEYDEHADVVDEKGKGAERKDEKQARKKEDNRAENDEAPKPSNKSDEDNVKKGKDRQTANGKGTSTEEPNDGEGGEEGEFRFPLSETINITAILEDLKEQNSGKWDGLQGQALSDILPTYVIRTLSEFRADREQAHMRVNMHREAMRQRERLQKDVVMEREERKRQMQLNVQREEDIRHRNEIMKRFGTGRLPDLDREVGEERKYISQNF